MSDGFWKVDPVAIPALGKAAALANEVEEQLDDRTRECDACGLTHYEDVNQYRASQALKAAITKLDKAISLIQASIDQQTATATD